MSRRSRIRTRAGSAILCTAAIAVAAGVAGCGSSSPGGSGTAVGIAGSTLTIYSSANLQGPSAPDAQSIDQAELLALEQDKGRVGKYAIRLVVLDDSGGAAGTWSPASVKENAEQAAGDPTAVAYLGEDSSGATADSLPVLNRAGIPQVSPTATADALTSGGAGTLSLAKLYPTGRRSFTRVIPDDGIQALAQSEYQSQEQCQEVYILQDGSLYGDDLAAAVAAEDSERGISVVGRTKVSPAQTSFGRLSERVSRSGASCMFFGGEDETNTAAMWTALGGASSTLKLFGPDSLATTSFSGSVGSAGGRTFLTSPGLAPGAYGDLGQSFYRSYQDRFGTVPSPEAIFGYEAMAAVLSSVAAAQHSMVTRTAVTRQLFSIRNRRSVLGTYSIDAQGNTTLRTYGAYVISDGELAFSHVLDAATT